MKNTIDFDNNCTHLVTKPPRPPPPQTATCVEILQSPTDSTLNPSNNPCNIIISQSFQDTRWTPSFFKILSFCFFKILCFCPKNRVPQKQRALLTEIQKKLPHSVYIYIYSLYPCKYTYVQLKHPWLLKVFTCWLNYDFFSHRTKVRKNKTGDSKQDFVGQNFISGPEFPFGTQNAGSGKLQFGNPIALCWGGDGEVRIVRVNGGVHLSLHITDSREVCPSLSLSCHRNLFPDHVFLLRGCLFGI